MNLIGQGCHYAWVWLMDLVEASGMTKPVFIGFIITTAVLATVFGTLRALYQTYHPQRTIEPGEYQRQ